MLIKVNGEDKEYPGEITVTALLQAEQVKMPEMVSVELNGEILQREDFAATSVKDGDSIEFLYFMGGGA